MPSITRLAYTGPIVHESAAAMPKFVSSISSAAISSGNKVPLKLLYPQVEVQGYVKDDSQGWGNVGL